MTAVEFCRLGEHIGPISDVRQFDFTVCFENAYVYMIYSMLLMVHAPN